MKKIIIIIVIIIVVFLTLFFFVFKKPENKTLDNNTANNISNNLITIDYKVSTEYFIFNKLDIYQDNKTIKLYFNRLSDEVKNNRFFVSIYDESDYLENFNIDLSRYNNLIEFTYENDLHDAQKYSIEYVNENATVG